jgi:hypothetical protein
MRTELRWLPIALAGAQAIELLVSAVAHQSTTSRLDHLRVPRELRPLLPRIKGTASVGLLVGLRVPRMGVAASAILVSSYSAAVMFHHLGGDSQITSLPAASFATTSALCLIRFCSAGLSGA